MTVQFITPTLGILDGDCPSAKMLVVKYGTKDAMKWAYVAPGHVRDKSHDVTDPESFTLLSQFGVHATMAPDGLLAVHQLAQISVAKYQDGKPRHWQGAPQAKIQIQSRIARHVVDAVRLDFEARRAKAAS